MNSFSIEAMGVAFALSAALACVIVTLLLLRKISFKQFAVAALLAGAFVFWFSYSLGTITFPWNPEMRSKNNFIPFAVMTEAFGDPLIRNEILLRMGATFLFGVLWGLLSRVLFKTETLKSFSLMGILMLLPPQVIIMICCFTDISYCEFDTGNFILLLCGMYVGRGILRAAKKVRGN